MRLLNDSEYDALRKQLVGAADTGAWMANPLALALFNAVRRIPCEAAASENSTAAERALSVVGALRVRDAVLAMIADPSYLDEPAPGGTPEADYGSRKIKETTNA